MTIFPLALSDADPQAGDIVIYRERAATSGPCTMGFFPNDRRTSASTYADALRDAAKRAASDRVDVWTTFRVRWADTAPQTFERLARHRPAPRPVA